MFFCLAGSSCSSSRQNLTLSLSSVKDKGSQSCNYVNGGLFSKYSDSAQSLASVSKENYYYSYKFVSAFIVIYWFKCYTIIDSSWFGKNPKKSD